MVVNKHPLSNCSLYLWFTIHVSVFAKKMINFLQWRQKMIYCISAAKLDFCNSPFPDFFIVERIQALPHSAQKLRHFENQEVANWTLGLLSFPILDYTWQLMNIPSWLACPALGEDLNLLDQMDGDWQHWFLVTCPLWTRWLLLLYSIYNIQRHVSIKSLIFFKLWITWTFIL